MNRRAVLRVGAYVLFVVVGVGGMWRVETTASAADRAAQDAKTALAALEEEREVDAARQCVSAWEGRRGVRSLIDGLIAASAGADPERVEAFREDMARRLPDPECDLDAAEARIEPPED